MHESEPRSVSCHSIEVSGANSDCELHNGSGHVDGLLTGAFDQLSVKLAKRPKRGRNSRRIGPIVHRDFYRRAGIGAWEDDPNGDVVEPAIQGCSLLSHGQ